VDHGIFHKRLDDERGDLHIKEFLWALDGKAQTVGKPELLDSQVFPDKPQFLLDGDVIMILQGVAKD